MSEGITGHAVFDGSFSNVDWIAFGGVSLAYAPDHGTGSYDIAGYYESSGHYYLRRYDIEIRPIQVIDVKGFRILVADSNSLTPYTPWFSPPEYALSAYVNLPNPLFPGFVFFVGDTRRLPPDTFFAILESMTVTAPGE